MNVEYVAGFLFIGKYTAKVKDIVTIEPESNADKLNQLERLEKVLPAELAESLAKKLDKPEPSFSIDIVVRVNEKQSTAMRIPFTTETERDVVLEKVQTKLKA